MQKRFVNKSNDVGNVTVVEGDVLKVALPEFNKVIAIPPYYLSSRLIAWLVDRRIDCAVLILQREFANRLVAAVGSEDYGWLTVLTCQHAETELLDIVPKSMFYPTAKSGFSDCSSKALEQESVRSEKPTIFWSNGQMAFYSTQQKDRQSNCTFP